MITRLEIATRPELQDPRGEGVARKIRSFLGIPVERVRTRDVYRLDAELRQGEADRILGEFVDPVLHHGALGRLDQGRFDVAVTVGYKPGVTDPVGKSARVAIEDTLGRALGDDAAVYCSRLYLLEGVQREQAETIAGEVLANPVIQTTLVQSWDEWQASPPDLAVPRVSATGVPAVERISLAGDDAALLDLSRRAAARPQPGRDDGDPRPLPRRRPGARPARRPGWGPTPPTPNWNAWRRPGASTASTRSSTRRSPTRKRASRRRRSARCSTATSAGSPMRSTANCARRGAGPGWSPSSTTTQAWSPSTSGLTWSTRSRRTTPRPPWIPTAARSPASSA